MEKKASNRVVSRLREMRSFYWLCVVLTAKWIPFRRWPVFVRHPLPPFTPLPCLRPNLYDPKRIEWIQYLFLWLWHVCCVLCAGLCSCIAHVAQVEEGEVRQGHRNGILFLNFDIFLFKDALIYTSFLSFMGFHFRIELKMPQLRCWGGCSELQSALSWARLGEPQQKVRLIFSDVLDQWIRLYSLYNEMKIAVSSVLTPIV